MSSDNTVPEAEESRNPRVDCSLGEGPTSDNTWLSSLAEKCSQHRTMGKPKGDYSEFLSSAFGCPASEALARMYVQEQMSLADIRTWLIANVGWSVCERQVNVILKRSGIVLRGYAERRRLTWKQGKLDQVQFKRRQTCKQMFYIGSAVEKMVRYLLQVSLSVLGLPWHVIIGDDMQVILPRYEVDIPVAVIDPSTGLSCRFAIEVDATFVHGTDKAQLADRAKDAALRAAGWRVYRMNSDSALPIHVVPQVVDIAMDIKRVCQDVLSARNADGRTANCCVSESVLPSSVL